MSIWLEKSGGGGGFTPPADLDLGAHTFTLFKDPVSVFMGYDLISPSAGPTAMYGKYDDGIGTSFEALIGFQGAAGYFFNSYGQTVSLCDGIYAVNTTGDINISAGSHYKIDGVNIGGGSVSFGTTTQIPYMNLGGTDFLYSPNFIFDGTTLVISNVATAWNPGINLTNVGISGNSTITGSRASTDLSPAALNFSIDDFQDIASGGTANNFGINFYLERDGHLANQITNVKSFSTYATLGAYAERAGNQAFNTFGFDFVVNTAPRINKASGNMTINSYGMQFELEQNVTVTAAPGTNILNCYGIKMVGGGPIAPGFTTNFYALYNSMNASYTNNWFLYNVSAANNWLGMDNSLTYFGTGLDATIGYDGTNFVINPKAVGTGIVDILGILQTDGYKSSDGTSGASTTTGGLTFKDGLYTSGSISGGGSPGGSSGDVQFNDGSGGFGGNAGGYFRWNDSTQSLSIMAAGSGNGAIYIIGSSGAPAATVASYSYQRFGYFGYQGSPESFLYAYDNSGRTVYILDGSYGINTSSINSTAYYSGGIPPVVDGTYTVGLGLTTNGTITVQGGIITAIQQAT